VSRLILVLGDQLTRGVAALREYRDGDLVVMAEVESEAAYVRHHPKKIAFTFAAMRKFATALRRWSSARSRCASSGTTGSWPAMRSSTAGAGAGRISAWSGSTAGCGSGRAC
jgi:hypothetical protein